MEIVDGNTKKMNDDAQKIKSLGQFGEGIGE